MNYLYSSGIIAATLYFAYVMIQRAKRDKVIGNLKVKSPKEREAEAAELAKLTQEVENAQIKYRTARDVYRERITADQGTNTLPDEQSKT